MINGLMAEFWSLQKRPHEIDKRLGLRPYDFSVWNDGEQASGSKFIVGQHPHKAAGSQIFANMKIIKAANAGATEAGLAQ